MPSPAANQALQPFVLVTWGRHPYQNRIGARPFSTMDGSTSRSRGMGQELPGVAVTSTWLLWAKCLVGVTRFVHTIPTSKMVTG